MAHGITDLDRGVWEQRGGRIRFDSKGRPVFIIRKQIAGKRYEVSTHRHTLAAALMEWEKFEKDPEGYAAGDPSHAALYLDLGLSKRFLEWSASDRHNSENWLAKQKNFLADWMETLKGVNLRRLSLRDHVVPALSKASSRRHRLAVLKGFYSWMRKVEHILTSAEDPLIDMPLPQVEPAQWKKSKVIPREHLDLVLEHLTSPWRDALLVQCGTGWHTTEVVRFASTGTIEPLPRSIVQEGVAAVLVLPEHKSGEPLRTRVSAPVMEAAKKLLANAQKRADEREKLREVTGDKKLGGFSREWYDRAVRSACAAVKRPDGGIGIPVFTPGRLRHSVATWAIDSGAEPASVAAFLGHKSPRTTKKFYAVHASPAKVPTLA